MRGVQFTNTNKLHTYQENIWKIRNIPFEILQNGQVPNKLIKVLHNIYKKTLTAAKVGKEYSEWKRINQGVHQGCNISLLLFITYINNMIRKWQLTLQSSITINRHLKSDTLHLQMTKLFWQTQSTNCNIQYTT